MVFPMDADDAGMNKLEDIRAAMKNIGELLPSQGTPQKSQSGDIKIMSWSHNWLKSIGHEETNPVTLAKFSLHWQRLFIDLYDAIEEFGKLL